jgi:hypothetical protein
MLQKTTTGHNREELQFSPPLKTRFNKLLNISHLIHTLKTKNHDFCWHLRENIISGNITVDCENHTCQYTVWINCKVFCVKPCGA